jgi:hypothetical protein
MSWYQITIYLLVVAYCVGLIFFLVEYYKDPTLVSDEPDFWCHVLAVIVLLFWPIVLPVALTYERYHGK